METHQLRRIPVLPGLKKYGDTTRLYTKSVALYVIFFSFIFSVQWVVDIWAWGNTWGFAYAANDNLGWAWSRILGIVFASVIAIFEILYITQDRSDTSTQDDIFRFLFAVCIGCGLTSVAVEVSWFAPDIEKSIVAEEKASIDKVVQMASATEEKKRNQLLAAAKSELGENAVAEAEKAQGDINRYVAERKSQRDSLVVGVEKAQSEARTEAAGKISGRYGNGPAAKMMAAQAENLAAEINTFDAETAKEVARLTTLRDTKQENNRQALQKRLDQIRKDMEAVIDRIATLAGTDAGRDQLVAAYGGGSWRESRGALHRFSKMVEMTDAYWTPAWYVKWFCRCMMLVFAIVIVGGKRFAPKDWKEYCNRGRQSRAGHYEARSSIIIEGFDPDTYGLSPEIKQRLEEHFAARQQLAGAHQALNRKICELVVRDPSGICLTMDQIESALRSHWLHSGEEYRTNLVACEEAMKREGISVPVWPAMLADGSDLLRNVRPWSVSKDQLNREYGWIDPTNSIEERRRIATNLESYQISLRNLLSKQADVLRTAIETDPHVPINVLRRQSRQWLEKEVFPILDRMKSQEQRLRQLGGVVPTWPHYFPDPRAEIMGNFADFSESELGQMGWIGPEEHKTA